MKSQSLMSYLSIEVVRLESGLGHHPKNEANHLLWFVFFDVYIFISGILFLFFGNESSIILGIAFK